MIFHVLVSSNLSPWCFIFSIERRKHVAIIVVESESHESWRFQVEREQKERHRGETPTTPLSEIPTGLLPYVYLLL